MKTHTFTSTFSPMDDADLQNNFKVLRKRWWIKQGLWIPEDVTVTFGKFQAPRSTKRNGRLIAYFNGNDRITLTPELSFLYCYAHMALIHEMAHLYVAVKYQDNRRCGHGETFYTEIDRLTNLGAFRFLI